MPHTCRIQNADGQLVVGAWGDCFMHRIAPHCTAHRIRIASPFRAAAPFAWMSSACDVVWSRILIYQDEGCSYGCKIHETATRYQTLNFLGLGFDTGSIHVENEQEREQFLQVQACAVADIALNEFLTRPHLLEQCGISNDSCRVLDFPARLVQPCNDSDNGSLHDVC